MSKRLSKQEAKEDRVLVAATQAAEIVKRNARVVLAAAAVVVAAVVIAAFVAQARVRAEKDATGAMAQAERTYFSGDFAQAATQFQTVADRFGSSKAARSSLLFLGNAQLAAGNASAAEQAYRKFLGKSGLDGILESAGQRGLASSLYAQQKTAEAAKAFEKAAEVSGNLMAGDDWFHAGRAYEQAGQKADAVRAYRHVIDDFPQNAMAQDARVRMQECLAAR